MIDKFETRKSVFNKNAIENISEEFVYCIKSKRRYYFQIKNVDKKISIPKKRPK